ncbi:putative membrane protein [Clostridioides difficile 6042]|nr:hypothetical protein [Clostridioides difficile]EQG07702.1 putative membrane protein [Clostridioides difficile 6042]
MLKPRKLDNILIFILYSLNIIIKLNLLIFFMLFIQSHSSK